MLLTDQDKLLTDTLAEEFQLGMKVFMANIVCCLAQPVYRELFLESETAVPTIDMVEQFIGDVERAKLGHRGPSDRNVMSKGQPRKGGPGKRQHKG